MMIADPSKAVEIFYSYSSQDETLRNKLETQLKLLERQGHITSWYNRKVVPGTEWANEIDIHLNLAHIILLLISPDYIASDYCYGIEMKQAIKRHEAGEARVIPVILRPVEWREAPFGQLYALPKQAKPVTTWQNRDAAFVDIAKGIRKAIDELNSQSFKNTAHQNALEVGKISSLPSIWNVPYRRNPFFIDRDEILQSLHDNFIADITSLSLRPQALSGLGGVGKTQIAIEYAFRYHHEYHTVLWVNAESRELLASEFVGIAELLKLPRRNVQEQVDAINAVESWLKVNTSWLLVLDNAEDLEMIVDFIPSEVHGHILLTTRRHAMGEIAQRVKIDVMEPEVGAKLLLCRAGIIGRDGAINDASLTERTKAKEISHAMDGLPLGLDQAAAYIEETDCGVSSYLALFQKEGAKLLQRRGKGVSSHPEPVSTTWALSFEKVQQTKPATADLLRLCAFLHPDIIPIEIITEGTSELGSILQSIANDPLKLDITIEELLKYSLIRRDPQTNTLSIHRLVQKIIKDDMNEDEQRQWVECSVRVVNQSFPSSEFPNWSRCQRYLVQAQACSILIEQWGLEFLSAAELLYKAGWYMAERAQYTQAAPLLQRSLKLYEKMYGPEHSRVADSISKLGLIYTAQGKYTQAESLLQQALALYEKIYGLEHNSVAQGLRNLALVYTSQGKIAQAEPLLQRALAICEKLYKDEPEHPEIATSLSYLGANYWHQRNYTKAEPLMKRSLDMKEKSPVLNHRDIALEFNNLAALYKEQGKYVQAASLGQRAIKTFEKILGTKHPDYAGYLDNLAGSYRMLHRYPEAEKLLKRAIAILEKTLGVVHLDLALSLNNLALLYADIGKDSQAEPLYQRAIEIQEKALEFEHPNMAIILTNYAALLRRTKRKFDAIELETRAKMIENRHKQEHNII